ncbi:MULTISPECIES: carboxylesterase/lipase family protein [unclassified Sphingobium]|uniref:carboxylesterase/lipase family protein n=1 Tax=unclassified Sphingobium TaxID=2611147 RepID=UPI000D1646C6|nr:MULTISPECIES: carboxylesterase family protein [unclassified Sphingobium]PSO09700.1 carboxylesterase [Sphingobium sp. AEW4]TWD19021.1 para-nitrobenzyl esterase [Sphingobium sp. AEW013]
MLKSKCSSMLLAAVLLTGQAQAGEVPVAAVREGRLLGASSEGIDSFKGIPFAAPPVGDLRWRAPQPAQRWQGTRDATRYGDACVQPVFDPAARFPMSEDCLTLNVWTPAGAKTGKRLPVMLWIHGGGSFAGSGRDPLFDGAALAREGVIVVTINYRLGALGYFAHPALTASNGDQGLLANYGLMDQRAAMRWVQRNIAAFGGDPAQVTIFGESAGGCYVNMWMTSPLAKGLFARAISHSCPEYIESRSMAEGNQRGRKLAHGLGIDGAGAEALARLRARPASDFVTPAAIKGTYPFIDGRIVAEDPFRALEAGRVASLPWMIGSNSFDASYLPYFGVDISKPLAAYSEADRARILATYDASAQGEQRRAMHFLSDVVMGAGDRAFAAQAAAKGAPTWLYSFRYESTAAKPGSLGVAHGEELAYVFGNPGRDGVMQSAADRAVSARMRVLWSDFAKARLPLSDSWSSARRTYVFDRGGNLTAVTDFHRERLDLAAPFARNAAGPWDP